MASRTYYAKQDISIQSCPINKGQVVGTGDVGAGEFKPAKGLEKHVEIDHVQARLGISISDKKPDDPQARKPDPPAKTGAEPEAASEASEDKAGKKKAGKKKAGK